mgnify:CR=1 FL=1|jgi:hypothetical protein
MTQYTVRTRKEVKNLDEGHLWSEELPDSMFVKKFNFTGHEFGPVRRGPKHYELFWDPKTLKSAIELLTLLDKHKMTAKLEVIQK